MQCSFSYHLPSHPFSEAFEAKGRDNEIRIIITSLFPAQILEQRTSDGREDVCERTCEFLGGGGCG